MHRARQVIHECTTPNRERDIGVHGYSQCHSDTQLHIYTERPMTVSYLYREISNRVHMMLHNFRAYNSFIQHFEC